jgi:plasmid stability protein
MAQLTIRQLDDVVAARLRERAATAGHSMEQEVRDILTAACADLEAVLARLKSRLASYGDRRFSDSGELVRGMRDERSGLG